MKLLDLIRPRFGAISVCGSFLGDSRNERALDKYDEDGITRQDANCHLFANLKLDDVGALNRIVRLEYDKYDSLSRIYLEVQFKETSSLEQSHLWILKDYLRQSEFFDSYLCEDKHWVFWNCINEIYCEQSDTGFVLEVYPPWAKGDMPKEDYVFSTARTVSSLIRREREDWMAFAEEAMAKKVKLKYSRESDEYPCLWLVVREEEFKQNPARFVLHLTNDLLRRIMAQAGWQEASESWEDNYLKRIILDPISLEPMELVQVDFSERVKPMSEEQFEKILNEIDVLDRERTSPPPVWDESPVG